MGLDPNIILASRETPQFDPIAASQKALALRQAQMQVQTQQRLRDLATSNDITTPEGQDAILKGYGAVDPLGAMGAMQKRDLGAQELAKAGYNTQEAQLAAQKAQADKVHAFSESQSGIMLAAKQALANVPPGSPQEQQIFGQLNDSLTKNAQQAGFYDPAHPAAQQQIGDRQTLDYKLNETMGLKNQMDMMNAQRQSDQLSGPAKDLLSVNQAEKDGKLSAADAAALRKKITTIASQGGGVLSLSPEAVAMAADAYEKTGILPNFGFGAAGTNAKTEIANAAAKRNGGTDLASAKADYAANSASLKTLQKNLDQVEAFESTAGKNLDLFISKAQKMKDTGSPWLNTPLRALQLGAMGSEDQAAANAARTVALTEIAKVVNNPGLSGQLSDSARHEVESLNPANATIGQILNVATVLKQDMSNRHESMKEQLQTIKGRIGGGSSQAASGPQPGEPTAVGPGGHIIVYRNGHWVDPQTGKAVQ